METTTLDYIKTSIEEIARSVGFSNISFYNPDNPNLSTTITPVGKPTTLMVSNDEVYRFKVHLGYSKELLAKGIKAMMLHEKYHHSPEANESVLDDPNHREAYESQANLGAAAMWNGNPLEFVTVRLLSQGRHPKYDEEHIKRRYSWLREYLYKEVVVIIEELSKN